MAVMSKILIIDDEPQLRGLLARIISLEGYDVLQAENCASGLKILQRETPDVVSVSYTHLTLPTTSFV